MVFIAAGAAVGTLLALLRGRVLLPILVSAFFAIVVALCGLLLGYHLGLSALVGFGSITWPWVSLSIYSPQKMLCHKYRPRSDNSCALNSKYRATCRPKWPVWYYDSKLPKTARISGAAIIITFIRSPQAPAFPRSRHSAPTGVKAAAFPPALILGVGVAGVSSRRPYSRTTPIRAS